MHLLQLVFFFFLIVKEEDQARGCIGKLRQDKEDVLYAFHSSEYRKSIVVGLRREYG